MGIYPVVIIRPMIQMITNAAMINLWPDGQKINPLNLHVVVNRNTIQIHRGVVDIQILQFMTGIMKSAAGVIYILNGIQNVDFQLIDLAAVTWLTLLVDSFVVTAS